MCKKRFSVFNNNQQLKQLMLFALFVQYWNHNHNNNHNNHNSNNNRNRTTTTATTTILSSAKQRPTRDSGRAWSLWDCRGPSRPPSASCRPRNLKLRSDRGCSRPSRRAPSPNQWPGLLSSSVPSLLLAERHWALQSGNGYCLQSIKFLKKFLLQIIYYKNYPS